MKVIIYDIKLSDLTKFIVNIYRNVW